ncbi:MAG TPA: phosphotransferase family protein [Sporichthyaceae bacterium]|nr:phosphotransferase family protein [Sporichthyaceae bacterium]
MSDLQDTLTGWLATWRPETTVAVTEPVLLGGGSSKQNWAFDAVWSPTGGGDRISHQLILRQDAEQGVVSTSLAVEAELMDALAGTGVPVPVVYGVDTTAAIFAVPTVVVGRLSGRADRAVLRDVDPLGLGPDGRLALAHQLADLLADIHAVDAAMLTAVLPDPGPDPAAHGLAHWTSELAGERARGHGGAPVLNDTLAWLAAHLPAPPGRQVLVHGDFRPANVLVEGGRVTALLDWELAHLGDPVDDLGWYTGAIYRREHFLDGWTVEDLLARYHERTGFAPDPARLRFWQVFSTFRLTVIAVRAVRLLAEGSPMGKAAPVERLYALLAKEIG